MTGLYVYRLGTLTEIVGIRFYGQRILKFQLICLDRLQEFYILVGEKVPRKFNKAMEN